jgi:hypothetical protein
MADETDLAEERNRSNVGANGGASAETRGEEGVAGAHGRSDDGQDGCEEPARLCCPVTQIMFRDPVFVPDSGNTYERQALETFWRAQSRAGAPPRDPLNNTVLATTQVFPNWDKRREVNAWLQAHPDYVPIGWASRDDIPPAATHGQNGRPFEAGGLHRHDGRGVHVELNLHIQVWQCCRECRAGFPALNGVSHPDTGLIPADLKEGLHLRCRSGVASVRVLATRARVHGRRRSQYGKHISSCVAS